MALHRHGRIAGKRTIKSGHRRKKPTTSPISNPSIIETARKRILAARAKRAAPSTASASGTRNSSIANALKAAQTRKKKRVPVSSFTRAAKKARATHKPVAGRFTR